MDENAGVFGDTQDSSDDVDRLLSKFYRELCRLAWARIEQHGLLVKELTSTDLVHETYLRLVGVGAVSFEGDRHFFFAACRAMRDIMVERGRRMSSLKRGADYLQVELEDVDISVTAPRSEEFMDLDCALEKLEHERPNCAEVVRLRYFEGFSIPEVAETTGFSQATVKRRWLHARVWLQRELSKSPFAQRVGRRSKPISVI